ncbi:MAG TPA: haloacid dehalogenase-like hydrolase [Sandaracinaceae bacterium LLY-WYZ-13_1]|nr:haloacid dehalogenase-like hydrolase [Sandaracinaceae bacterium LLY-WYZ-13_1]
MRPPPLPHQLDVLSRVLATVTDWSGERAPAVVFDLDATLFDNRPRTLEILMEYREEIAAEDPELADAMLSLEVDRIDYLLTDTLKVCGIYRADLVKEISVFWHDRFFSDEYIACDVATVGAPEYVRAIYEAGAVVVYLTGRDIPGMLVGTVAKLRDDGFPIAVAGTELILKPDPNMSDEAFKRRALPTLDRVGELVAFFDNEPANCNLAKAMFPDAEVALLETQKVPGAPDPVGGVEVVADFRMD